MALKEYKRSLTQDFITIHLSKNISQSILLNFHFEDTKYDSKGKQKITLDQVSLRNSLKTTMYGSTLKNRKF